MAASVANVARIVSGIPNLVYADVTLDSAYNLAGEPVTASQFGLVGIKQIFAANADGYAVKAVRTNDTSWLLKIFAAYSATTSAGVPVEATTSTDFSATVVSCLVVGN